MPISNTEQGRRIAVVFGIPFHELSISDALEDCKRSINTQKPTYISTIDLELAVNVNKDHELKHVVFHAERVICRSKLMTYIAKNFGITWLKKLRLSALLPSILAFCDNNKHSIYLLGSNFKDLIKTQKFIQRRYPNINIVGTQSRPDGEIHTWNNREIAHDIEKARPNLLLCALGDIENIKWIGAHFRNYRANLSFPLGNDFRCIRGGKINGEGYWEKFLSDPLFYLKKTVEDGFFLWKELRQQQQEIHKIRKKEEASTSTELTASHVFHKIVWQGRIEQLKLGETQMPPDNTRNIVCECAGVSFIDSAGLGQIAHLKRTSAKYGKFFCLYKPSNAITKALKAMHLNRHIISVWSPEALEDELKRHEESLVLIK